MSAESSAKQCSSCGELRPLDAFYFVSRKVGTRRGQCKDCCLDIRAAQRDPTWLPTCAGCGQSRERAGPGRRLCQACFDAKYEAEFTRKRGSHALRLPPCPACGMKRLREDHVKGTALCPVCRSVPQGRRNKLKNFYNMNPREYLVLLAAQGGVCAICKKKPRQGFAIDHQHKSPSIIRGAICTTCNTLLGVARDQTERLLAAAAYLDQPPAQILFPNRVASAQANQRFSWMRRSGKVDS